MADYIVTLHVTDDNDGRARREVKQLVRKALNDAWPNELANGAPGPGQSDLYLRDITVAEVV